MISQRSKRNFHEDAAILAAAARSAADDLPQTRSRLLRQAVPAAALGQAQPPPRGYQQENQKPGVAGCRMGPERQLTAGPLRGPHTLSSIRRPRRIISVAWRRRTVTARGQ